MAEEVEETDLKKGKSRHNLEALLLGETTKSRVSNKTQNLLGTMNLNGVTQYHRNLQPKHGEMRR
jgi:hypothetical protein